MSKQQVMELGAKLVERSGEYIPGEINIVEKAEELGLTATPEETEETEETTTDTAEALKAEEVKETETHTMRGTDKQLYLAEHIQQVTLETMEYMIAYANTKGREQAPAKAEALIGKLTRMKDALEKASYAGDVIECFRGVEEAQDTNGRVAAIMSAIKLMAPMTAGQRKLLDR